jgi:hypothetical protein
MATVLLHVNVEIPDGDLPSGDPNSADYQRDLGVAAEEQFENDRTVWLDHVVLAEVID